MTMCSPPPTVDCVSCGHKVAIIYKPPGAIVAAPMPPEGEYPVRCSLCGTEMVATIQGIRDRSGVLASAHFGVRRKKP